MHPPPYLGRPWAGSQCNVIIYAVFRGPFQVHIMALEAADQESQQALLVGMEYLLSISFVDDDEVRRHKCTYL